MRIQSPTIRYIPLLIIDFGVLLLIAYAILFRAIFPAPGIRIEYRTGIIKEADTDGFFYQQGMRSGDQVVLVNGIPWFHARSVYDGARVGEVGHWEVKRGNSLIEISVGLEHIQGIQRIQNNIPLFVALVYWGLATLLWFYNPRYVLVRRFFILGQVVATVLAGGSLDEYTVRCGFGVYLFAVLWIVPVTIHFFASFPLQYRSRLARLAVGGGYGTALFLSIPLLFSLFGRPFLWPDEMTLGIIFLLFVTAIALSLTFLVRHRFEAPLLVRQRRHIILAGILISLLPVLGYYLITGVLGQALVLSLNWLYLGLIFFPVSVAFALYSGELGKIDWFLNRTLVNVLLFGLMAGIYAGLFWVLDSIIPKTHSLFLPVSTLLFLLLAVLFTPLHRLLQYGIDQLFYRGWYDYQAVFEKTGEGLMNVKQPEDLAHAVLKNLTLTMRLRCACILLPISHTEGYARLFAYASEIPSIQNLSNERFALNSPFFQVLQQLTEPATTETIFHKVSITMLSPAERTLLNRRFIRLWIPVNLQSNSISDHAGALIVGAKLDGEPLSANDKVILENLAHYVAIVVQNLQLMDQLQQRERELTHLYRNLTLAREEERGRIARDLHDKVIQDLHVIHYKLQESDAATPESTQVILDDAARLLRESIDDIRRICYNLRPATLDVLGLPAVLRTLARQLHQRTGIEADVIISGNELMNVPEQIENMLFRIAQETLWNVEKHARASRVLIQLVFSEDASPPEQTFIRLIIEDDGIGFNVDSVSDDLLTRNAYGLLNMKERTSIIGGRFHLYSRPGEGTRIVVKAPLDPLSVTHGAANAANAE